MRKGSLFLLAVTIILFLSQVFFAINVGHTEFDLNIAPGESGTFSFEVTNDESEATRLKVYVGDWDMKPNGELRFLEPGTLPRSAANWMAVSPSQFDLEPSVTKEVRFSINVPKEVEGTYCAMIFVEGSPKPVVIEGGVTILKVVRFGIQVYETPPGSGRQDGRITKVQRLGLNPLTFLIDFENTGTVHLHVSGEVQIINSQGKTVEEIAVAQFPILPGAVREVRAVGSAPRPAAGRYYALAVLDFGGDYIPAGQLIFNIPKLELVPISDSSGPPQDLDGDGFYEDVNGDGNFAKADPDLLEEELSSAAVQNNWLAFDFDNDGDADGDDVAALRGLLSE